MAIYEIKEENTYQTDSLNFYQIIPIDLHGSLFMNIIMNFKNSGILSEKHLKYALFMAFNVE
jgi:hypothetical protein